MDVKLPVDTTGTHEILMNFRKLSLKNGVCKIISKPPVEGSATAGFNNELLLLICAMEFAVDDTVQPILES